MIYLNGIDIPCLTFLMRVRSLSLSLSLNSIFRRCLGATLPPASYISLWTHILSIYVFLSVRAQKRGSVSKELIRFGQEGQQRWWVRAGNFQLPLFSGSDMIAIIFACLSRCFFLRSRKGPMPFAIIFLMFPFSIISSLFLSIRIPRLLPSSLNI